MKTIEQIERELQEGQARLHEACERLRQEGRNVSVTPEQIQRFADLCSRMPTVQPRPSGSLTELAPQGWIRC